MGDKITLKVDRREIFGKKVKQLRKRGLTPGVVYGAGIEPIAIQAEASEVARVYLAAGRHTPVQLAGVKKRIAMIKDVELNPTKSGVVRHIAFHAVRADEPVCTMFVNDETRMDEAIAAFRSGVATLYGRLETWNSENLGAIELPEDIAAFAAGTNS